MSFGRRLALYFVLIALVPTVALIAILLFVSEDSRKGKADARLAAGLETAVAVYGQREQIAEDEARRLAGGPGLESAVRSGDQSQLQAFANRAAASPRVVRVEVAERGTGAVAAGPANAVAFAQVTLTKTALPVGTLRVSSTTAPQYVNEVSLLTKHDLVVSRGGAPLAATVPDPPTGVAPGKTENLTVDGSDLRGHSLALNSRDDEDVLILGPRKEGGLLGIGLPATGILIAFLGVAAGLAWLLARTLTRLHDRVAEQAVTDPLTGLWNRRQMAETLDREVIRAQRFGHPISLLILDIDDFKQINDREGHLLGDVVIAKVADILRAATRAIDVAARYGGDELALGLLETDRQGALIVGERLLNDSRETRIALPDGRTMSLTLSVGIATIPDSADDLVSLFDAADRALLRAKAAGKNQLRTAPTGRFRPSRQQDGESSESPAKR